MGSFLAGGFVRYRYYGVELDNKVQTRVLACEPSVKVDQLLPLTFPFLLLPLFLSLLASIFPAALLFISIPLASQHRLISLL